MKKTRFLLLCLFWALMAQLSFACDTPGGLTATATATATNLAWSAVSGASSYTVEIENTLNNPTLYSVTVTASGSNYTATGLNSGQNYKFKVRTNCGGDHGDWSEWFSFATGSTTNGGGGGGGNGTCGIPGGLNTASNAGTTTLSWAAVAGATAYMIEVEDGSGNSVPFAQNATVNGTSFVPTGLTASRNYKFKVRSVCGSNQSDWSEWFAFTTGSTTNGGGGGNGTCGIPGGLNTATNAGTTTLSWAAVAGATSYMIEVEDGSGNSVPFAQNATVNGTSFVPTGLTASRNYKFKVRSVCGSNQSDWSEWFAFTTGSTTNGGGGGGGNGTCGIPGGLNTASNAGTTTLSWAAVAGATSYMIEVEDGSGNSVPFAQNATVNGTSFVPTGLTASRNYKFKVRSVCGSNQSDWSEWFAFTTGSTTNGGGGGGTSTCSIPAGLNAVPATGGINLTWNPVAGANAYSLEIENASGNNTFYHFTATSATNSYLATGLAAGFNFKFKVRSNCSGGQSDWSGWLFLNASNGTGNNGNACGVPSGLVATPGTTGSAILTWNVVAGAIRYNLEIEDGSGNSVPFKVTATVSNTIYTVAGLTAGKNYKFKVRAICNNGQSAWSAWMNFGSTTGSSTSVQPCSTPTGLIATANPGGSVSLTWNPIPGTSSYTIEVENASDNPTAFKYTGSSATTLHVVTGLTAGLNYKFKVRSICDLGPGAWSAWVIFNSATGGNASGTCMLPAGLGATPAAQSATLTWAAAAGAVSYQIEVESGNPPTPFFFFSATVTGTSFTVTGLQSNGSYKFKVRAICANGTTNWSGWMPFSTPASAQNKQQIQDQTTTAAPSLRVKVFPNPIQGAEVQVSIEGASGSEVTLRLVAASGKAVQSEQIFVDSNFWYQSVAIPSDLAGGVYYLQAISQGKVTTAKVIISQ